jgi:hypothetical protein
MPLMTDVRGRVAQVLFLPWLFPPFRKERERMGHPPESGQESLVQIQL